MTIKKGDVPTTICEKLIPWWIDPAYDCQKKPEKTVAPNIKNPTATRNRIVDRK